MPLTAEQLDAYCTRIAYSGPRRSDLATLSGIVAAHARAIPFENLDVLLRRPVRLDRDPLFDKLVRRRRGGYCFEHNTLLLQALAALGFDAEGLGARVVWLRNDDEMPPRTHMLLRVALPEGPYLADVGFGGLTLTSPLRLEAGPEQQTPHELHRLVRLDERELMLEARLGEGWTRLYRFTLERQFPIDYEVASWFTSTEPHGLFTNNLLMARPEPDCRYAMMNGEFTVRWRDGRREQRRIAGADDLGDILDRHFLVDLPKEDVAAVAAAILPAAA